MKIQNKLTFSVSDDGRHGLWSLPGTALSTTEGGDFWRIMADDFYYREMTIRSSRQTGTVRHNGNVTTVTYDGLYTDSGRRIDATLTLTVTDQGDRLLFGSTIANRDVSRLNELEYPYIDLASMVGPREEDVLYRPFGLGERIKDPWTALEKDHTEYMSADYHEIKSTLLYPRPASMAWLGIQSGAYFLYLGKQDPRTHACCLLNAIAPREATQPRLVSAICQYPCVRPNETFSPSDVAVSMFVGDWRGGSDLYGTFARETFYQPITPRPWVSRMTGWQRIILRHQYGDILYYYKDLPELYRKGKKYGLDTLLVFGWWKGRFDNGYPHYEIDEELGGEQGLKDAIAQVQRMGGRVILYNNGILIDKNTDFYRKYHHQAAKIDIDGNEYVMNYRFENDGTILRNYGYKTFYEACQATEEWYDVMERNAQLKLSFSPDSIFYDQLGGVVRLCFNDQHKHGPRPDDELHFRRENIRRLRRLLGPEQAIGTECTNDSVAGELDYLHGCDNGNFCRKAAGQSMNHLFPQLFRRTFPEIIMTNRFTHDCREGWKQELNYAFVHGFRFDVAVYRSRGDIEMLPEYASHVGKLLALKEKYGDYFYDTAARYVCETDITVPAGVRHAEYKGVNKRLFVFSNENAEAVTVSVNGSDLCIGGMDVACLEI